MPTMFRSAAGAAVLSVLLISAPVAVVSAAPPRDGATIDAPDDWLGVGLSDAIPPPDAPASRPPGTETVEVVLEGVADASAPVPQEVRRALTAAGAEVVGAGSGSVLLVEVPAGAAEALDVPGATVRPPVHMNVPLHAAPAARPAFGPIAGDSAAVIGALDWHAAGFDGAGVRIGVVDFFNMSFWNTAEMGPRPTAANGRAMCRFEGTDCLAGFDEPALPGDPRQHGPAVVEVIRDVAPRADIFVASAETYSDYLEVLAWFAANQVTIVSRSLGSLLDGPGDGRGPSEELTRFATSKGMIWLNAAGNSAQGGYWRSPAGGPTIIDGYVALDPDQTRTAMKVSGCTIAGLRWNDFDTTPAARTDYDLEVWRGNAIGPQFFVAAASSRRNQRSGSPPAEPIEQLAGACPQAGYTTYLRIKRVAGTPTSSDDDVLELLDYQNGLQYFQAPSSAAIPVADSTDPSVIAVGAVDPVSSTSVGYYSGQGPTNDGRTKPDLVAPSGVRSSVYTTFSGTSAATPAVAGAAALLQQAGFAAPGPALAALVRSSVRPLGSPVPNNVYGAGLLQMPTVPPPATAPSAAAYEALPEPLRIVDTRATSPVGPAALVGRRAPGTQLEIPVAALLGRPAGDIAAVALNLTVVDAPMDGWAQVIPTGQADVGAYSNLNIDAAGQTRSNIVQVPVGDDGSITVYAGSGGDVLVDVLGTYTPATNASAAGRFTAVDPVRVLDTRGGPGASGSGPDGKVRRGESVCVDTSTAGVDTAGGHVSALVLNVTATDVNATGYVQALPTGGTPGASSTLNVVAGATVANTTIVPLGGPCGGSPHSASVLFDAGDTDASAHLIVDVTGFVTGAAATPAATGLFVPLTPGRVFDSRPGVLVSGVTGTVAIAGATGPTPAVPADATGIVANLTATGTTGWGYLTAWPSGGALPATSSLNWSRAGATVANGAIVKLGPGGVLAVQSVTPGRSDSAAHLVDVFGYYT